MSTTRTGRWTVENWSGAEAAGEVTWTVMLVMSPSVLQVAPLFVDFWKLNSMVSALEEKFPESSATA